MKHKLLKFNAVILLGLGLTPLQGQITLNVKSMSGAQTAYTLSSIRKLTFPSTGNMSVIKFTGSVDNYALIGISYINIGDIGNSIEAITDDVHSNLRLYPNPVVDVLHIHLATTNSQTATLELLSIEGKLLYKEQLIGTSSYEVNISQFRQGIYLCRINNGTKIETSIFIKQ
ncbi:MAG: T9SS type A sorting domain-containing protein [Paludibacter sp.]